MRTDKPEFDAQLYKQKVRATWNESAEPWHNGRRYFADWLAEPTAAMFDMAGLAPGYRVLDIAAGAGDQSIAAAKRVAPTGSVLATDLSETILEFAARTAREEGVTNMETRRMDAEELEELGADAFDSAICRLGLMLMPAPVRALEGVRHALKPGCSFAGIVIGTPERNPLLSIPAKIVLESAGVPMPKPGMPGLFSMAAPGVFERALNTAGFRDVQVRTMASAFKAPSCREYMVFLRESAGALKQVLATMPEEARAETWAQVESTLTQFEVEGRFTGPCEFHIGTGRK